MKKQTHTPGSWEINEGFPYSIADIKANDGKSLTYRTRSIEERLANARLIAASPDLLEALHTLKRDARWLDLNAGAKKKIDAAIAKAEGKS